MVFLSESRCWEWRTGVTLGVCVVWGGVGGVHDKGNREESQIPFFITTVSVLLQNHLPDIPGSPVAFQSGRSFLFPSQAHGLPVSLLPGYRV